MHFNIRHLCGTAGMLDKFSGRVEITEHIGLVPLLGAVQKGKKQIYASQGCSLQILIR